MSLTMSHGPLSSAPAPANYRIDGPGHNLLFDSFPRRVRAGFAGATVFDTVRGRMLHETGLLPQLYVPVEDVDTALLRPSEHTTHCPFKGDATYWSLDSGDRTAENAAWAYEHPRDDASWLRGYRAFYWSSLDAWFDEDERVEGHLRDPYHRVDVRRTRRRVRVLAGGDVVAEAGGDGPPAVILSETALPNRYYLPPEAVRPGLLEHSGTVTVCPYKGSTTYWSLTLPTGRIDDAAWTYGEPFDEVRAIAGLVCFAHDTLTVEVDGETTDQRMPVG